MDNKKQVIVNGRLKNFVGDKITFDEAVALTFGNINHSRWIIFTVTYAKGPKENMQGSMTKGDYILVQDKMVFNITATDKS